MRHVARTLATLTAVALLPAACTSSSGRAGGTFPGFGSSPNGSSAGSSSAGSSSGAPTAMTKAQLTARFVTAGEAGLQGPARPGSPQDKKGVLTLSESFDDTAGISVLVILQGTPDAATAHAAVSLQRIVYKTDVGAGFHEVPIHLGDNSLEYAGADKVTHDPSVTIYVALGAITAEISVTPAGDPSGSLPVTARTLAERVARAQVAKLG